MKVALYTVALGAAILFGMEQTKAERERAKTANKAKWDLKDAARKQKAEAK